MRKQRTAGERMQASSSRSFVRSAVVGAALASSALSLQAIPTLGPNGNYYDIISAPAILWDEANALAEASSYLGMPGHLVTITSAEEDLFIDTLRDDLGFGQVWVGGFQAPGSELDRLAGWTWVNGEGTFPGVTSSSPYTNWAAHEPNDAAGPGSEQHLTIGRYGLGGGWNDEGAAIYLITGYAVEYEQLLKTVQAPEPVPDQGPWGMMTGLTLLGVVGAHHAARRKESF